MLFYNKYNPGKLSSVTETVKKYESNESLLWSQLFTKYNVKVQVYVLCLVLSHDEQIEDQSEFYLITSPRLISRQAHSIIFLALQLVEIYGKKSLLLYISYAL